MHPLEKALRSRLERTIERARQEAEAGAVSALEQLGVQEAAPYKHLSKEDRVLRRKLRAHARHLGNGRNAKGEQEIDRLIEEVAYEHWHRMLFARYLAENNLLIYPDPVEPVSITLEECQDLAADEGATNGWELASRYAARMLPQIFRPDSPVFELTLPPENQQRLERLVEDLPREVFTASDSLGWVYQFWQSRKKEEVNASEVKIGAKELPAVTQLFTEPYMVAFLLDNSLGAWWVKMCSEGSDQPAVEARNMLQNAQSEDELRVFFSRPGFTLSYLRFVKDDESSWTPAGGTFDNWPDTLKGFKTLDPCCGSGHFLIAQFLMLVPMRMELEGLSAREAVDKVLAENIHGLEIDQRCVQLAAFSLALAAWTYPGAGGYRPLPELNLACSGLAINARKEEWLNLANGDVKLRYTLDQMYDMFKNAPVLGSLLNPTRIAEQSYWTRENYQRALELVQKIMSREKGDYEKFEMGVVAQGIAKATTLLAEKYHFVVTNVPYLARGKQDEALKEFCQEYYKEAKNDLATVFLDRCLEFCINNNLVNQGQDRRQGVSSGNVSAVFPQNWLFLTSYKKFREKLLKQDVWQLIARLGPGAFETISGEVVKAILLSISRSLKIEKPSTLMLKKDMLQDAHSNMIRGLDVSDFHPAQEKAKQIYEMDINSVEQVKQLDNPDATIKLGNRSRFGIVRDFANCFQGLTTGDDLRLKRLFWEFIQNSDNYTYWQLLQAPSHGRSLYGGRHNLVDVRITTGELKTGALRGKDAWGKWGIAIDRVGSLSPAIYCGDYFHSLVPVIIPKFKVNLSFFLSFAKSSTLKKVAEETNQALSVDNGYFEKFEFDLNHWSKVAQEEYPHGLPQPYSDDPTQWIFHGHPCGSVIWDEDKKWTAHGPLRIEANVLHVAVARLLGYRWPAELDPEMELADEQRWWVQKAGELLPLADEDGIVCIPPVRGEAAAADRLFEILVRSYGSEWSNNILNQLLTEAGNAGKTLESWLRDKFFAQHCRLFHHRPFIWHIWDGLRDGFSALVNYHRLDFKNLETLTYTYLGDWIARQKQAVSEGVDAAEEKLAAAESLKKKLELILEGENPYDIFVRWKPIEKQPIGWNPDLNDGVRLNIRPFMTVGDVSKKGAGILRDKPNIKWNKDRGKDVQSAPWYHLFKGERINDHHLNLQEKFKSRGNNNEYN